MEEENQSKHPYKIMIGDKTRVFRKDYAGRTYYNAQIQQKNYDGTINKYYRPLNFKKGFNDLANETDIIIKDMFENLRPNKNDSYNPITALFITDYEIVERQEQIQKQALEDFRENLNEFENEYDIKDEDLPF